MLFTWLGCELIHPRDQLRVVSTPRFSRQMGRCDDMNNVTAALVSSDNKSTLPRVRWLAPQPTTQTTAIGEMNHP